MRALLWLSLTALVSPQSGDEEPRARPILERAGVLELTMPEREGVRVRHFRLDDPGSLGDPEATPVGIARLCLTPSLDGDPLGEQLEWETRFFTPAVRVHSVERLAPDTIELVWRELGELGRTVHTTWDTRSGEVETREAGGAAIRRRTSAAGEGLLTTSFLVEAMRLARVSDGEFRRLTAGTGEIEAIDLQVRELAQVAGGPGPRVAVWRRGDGSLAGRYLMRGDELLAYQLQAGGPIAHRISSAEHERLARRRGPAGRF